MRFIIIIIIIIIFVDGASLILWSSTSTILELSHFLGKLTCSLLITNYVNHWLLELNASKIWECKLTPSCIFHNHVDYIFSQTIRLLGLIRSVTFSFSSLQSLLMLYCTLVTPKLEYASVAWNSITSTDTSKLERIQRKFISLCHRRFIQSLTVQLC